MCHVVEFEKGLCVLVGIITMPCPRGDVFKNKLVRHVSQGKFRSSRIPTRHFSNSIVGYR